VNGRDDEDLARSRAEFAANVERRLAPRQGGPSEPRGSTAVLLTTGLLGTAMLAVLAAFLGGGLLYIPALIPLVTVCSVLASRKAK
jgi:hypothetical protein